MHCALSGVSSGALCAGPVCPHRWSSLLLPPPLSLLCALVLSPPPSRRLLPLLLPSLGGHSDLSGLRGVSWAVWERMRPNGGVTLEPAVRREMGRVEGSKVASGGQVEAGIHRWGGTPFKGGHLVCWFTRATAFLSMSMSLGSYRQTPSLGGQYMSTTRLVIFQD